MASVTLEHLGKSFGDTTVVKHIDTTIRDGEFLVLVGASGCGKSTLLRMVAGLEQPSSGRILIGERDVTALRPRDRDIAMVFQSYALYPHMTVRENLGFALKLKGVAGTDLTTQVNRAAEMLGLTPLLDRYPRDMSGGQRQRVAIGRAIVRRPSVFLFDEPLSNLDAALRGQMRVELKRLHAQLGVTTIYVTHDQVEAMTLADRILLMASGSVQQLGTPRELFDWPANRYTAAFLGSPGMNFVEAELRGSELLGPGVQLRVASDLLDKPHSGRVVVGVRPHQLHRKAQPGNGHIKARIDVLEPMGWETHVHLVLGAARWIARLDALQAADLRPGEDMYLHVNPDEVRLFHPDSGEALCSRPPDASEQQAS
jgi:multiple sugar transport system ATP-binding protein